MKNYKLNLGEFTYEFKPSNSKAELRIAKRILVNGACQNECGSCVFEMKNNSEPCSIVEIVENEMPYINKVVLAQVLLGEMGFENG